MTHFLTIITYVMHYSVKTTFAQEWQDCSMVWDPLTRLLLQKWMGCADKSLWDVIELNALSSTNTLLQRAEATTAQKLVQHLWIEEDGSTLD